MLRLRKNLPWTLCYPILLISISILFFSSPAIAHGEPESLTHTIEVTVDPTGGSVRGSDRICCFAGKASEINLLIGESMEVERISYGAEELEFTVDHQEGESYSLIKVDLHDVSLAPDEPLEFTYSVYLSSIEDAAGELHRGVSYLSHGVIGPRGAMLPASSHWYPHRPGGVDFFDVSVTTPEGFGSVMEGEWLLNRDDGGFHKDRWRTQNPLNGINLVISRFKVRKDLHKGIELYTFFFADEPELSERYLEKLKSYIDLYDGAFLPYPFKKFAVVESFLPTGFGMSSYTLMGSRVLRLPFIPDTSLGHEFVHSWWGNSVFVDPVHGNWSEALTTYTADHLYVQLKGFDGALAYRRKALADYRSYAGSGGIPFMDFRYGTSPEERAVAYNKGSAFFHMLRRLLGDKTFFEGLRHFYGDYAFSYASTLDIERSFEEFSGLDLKWFFSQWLARSGGPRITLKDPEASLNDDGSYKVAFDLVQRGEFYLLNVPLLIKTDSGDLLRDIEYVKPRQRVEVELLSRPVSMELDPANHIFRIMSPAEVPPSFASFFGDKGAVMLLPGDDEARKKYKSASESLSRDFGQEVISYGVLSRALSGTVSLFLFGGEGENPLFNLVKMNLPAGASLDKEDFKVDGRKFSLEDSVVAIAVKDRSRPERTLCLLVAPDGYGDLSVIAARLKHMTSRGYLVFGPDGALADGVFEGEKALSHRFAW